MHVPPFVESSDPFPASTLMIRDGDPRNILGPTPGGFFLESPAALAIADATSRSVVAANAALARLLRGSLEEVASLPLSELDTDAAGLAEYLLLAAAVGVDEPRRRRWKRRDQRDIPVEVMATPLHGGKGTRLILRVRDIREEESGERERRKLASQLHRTRRDEALNGLAGGIAHDFNNLLAVILPTLESVQHRLTGDEETRQDLDAISDAVVHARELTSALLTFSGRQAMSPRRVGLNDVVVGMEGLFRRTLPEDIDLVVNLGPGQVAIHADPAQIEQVLLNLVMNARDAMPRGGHLIVRTEETSPDEDEESGKEALEPGPHAILEVSDNGEGMDEETLKRMFEPFFSTRKRGVGAGLGMATTKGAVVQNGGHIGVVSAPGEGTTVRIRFPLHSGAPRVRRHAPRVRSETLATGTEHILLVEDDVRLRHQTARLLSSLGYTVTQAAAPEEALALHAELWDDEGRHPMGLLLTDLILPGMPGTQLVRELRVTRPGLPALFMSGYGDGLDSRGETPPEGLYLAKPFTLRALSDKVREALGAG